MAGCKLTQNITKTNCAYSVAGIKAVYLFNYDSGNEYTFGADEKAGEIATVTLAKDGVKDGKAYKIDFIDNTASFTDELAENGNGGKYRTHTLNFTISEYDYKILNQGDALSLGKFTAVVVDKSNRVVMIGRNNGLNATAFNYASGAGDADANGWTVTMAGTEMEVGRLVISEKIISDLVEPDPVIVP